MNLSHLLFLCAISINVVSCGGNGSPPAPPLEPSPVVFVFRLHGQAATEEFRVSSSSTEFLSQARAQLMLPEAQRFLFASGPIQAGNGGHNGGWHWHYTANVALAELAIELCDATPSMVEADLDYWLNTVQSFCPWSSYVYAEVQ